MFCCMTHSTQDQVSVFESGVYCKWALHAKGSTTRICQGNVKKGNKILSHKITSQNTKWVKRKVKGKEENINRKET